MTEHEENRWPLPLVVLAVIAAIPLLAWRFNYDQNRWSEELAAHPWTWPIRLAVFCLVGIPAYGVVRKVYERDKENDPLWKRLMHLLATLALGALLVGLLMLLDRAVP